MDVVLKDEIRSARKHYVCDAYSWWVRCNMSENDLLTDDQKLILQASEADKGKILPGQTYRYVRGVFDGKMVTWRARLGMDNLNRDIGLYGD